ncbi:alpha/beta hydrolase [Ornithinimicrobium cavernae]|uniref:alpha/beta hydrolase n=1 Tax=Ornithinimicrobium cavernae TaxID=2666047 RepID=UPI000D68F3CD|nr:alpha/beta hydrolase-fold protein [Ornithinimicrobium cavernae]
MTASTGPGRLRRYPRRRGVVGDLRVWRDVALPGLDRRSDIYVWLPPAYDRDRQSRYPVVYLHDGGNLFDPRVSFAGATWSADRALTALHEQGTDVIAVGIPCSPDHRIEEYAPYLGHRVRADHPDLGTAHADAYVAFLTDHLKPWVDSSLRTRPDREHTLVAGSSMGGVVSMHAWVRRPDVFGGVGAFSSAFWVPGEAHLRDIEAAVSAPHPPSRFYLDVGGREEPEDPAAQSAYLRDTERVVAALRASETPVRYVYDSQAYHFETAWAERLPSALAWLSTGYAVTRPGAPVTTKGRLRRAAKGLVRAFRR